MVLNTSDFLVHDVSRFPLVLARGDAPPGHAAQWIREMQALLAHGQPFVVVHAEPRAEEAHEDRKQRGLWLKQNRRALGAACRAVISVEPDAMRRAALAAQSALAQKAFGVPMHTAASLEQACADGLQRLEPPQGAR